jgi:hypothetical protein
MRPNGRRWDFVRFMSAGSNSTFAPAVVRGGGTRVRAANIFPAQRIPDWGRMKLPLNFLVQISQVGTLILACLGVWVAIITQRRQLNAQLFIEMRGRFQQLLRTFPSEAWLANGNPAHPLPESSREITDCTFYCLQLIADVYQLRRGGYVSARLWNVWEGEIRHTVQGRIFQREWEGLHVEFLHNPDFLSYINLLMTPKPQASAAPRPRDRSVAGV